VSAQANIPEKQLLTPEEVAAYLGVTLNWVYDHSTGRRPPEIPSFKLGKYRRYRRDEIERWIGQGAGNAA